MLCVAGTVAVVAAPPQLPAIVDPASAEHHAGKVIFVELVTPDLAAAKRFYTGLFGWTFRDVQLPGVHYAQAMIEGRPVAGLIEKPVPPDGMRQPAWLTFLSVRNVDSAVETASKQGAKVLFQPRDIPDRGRQAVMADPQGAVFALLASSNGDPPDLLAEPGEWIWSSLITSDPETDAAFYKSLVGYDVFDLPETDGARHLILASDAYARASANSLPANRPQVHPHWLNFLRVEDSVKATAAAVALGGRVLVEPRLDRHGGKLAIVADPQGAVFGVMEWPETESKTVTQ